MTAEPLPLISLIFFSGCALLWIRLRRFLRRQGVQRSSIAFSSAPWTDFDRALKLCRRKGSSWPWEVWALSIWIFGWLAVLFIWIGAGLVRVW